MFARRRECARLLPGHGWLPRVLLSNAGILRECLSCEMIKRKNGENSDVKCKKCQIQGELLYALWMITTTIPDALETLYW